MSPQPSICATLSVEPTSLELGERGTITVTAKLDHTGPITIFTWNTIFNLHLALSINYYCKDLTTNSAVQVCEGKKKRVAFNMELGGGDDRYFHTLEPGQPLVLTDSFYLPARTSEHYALSSGHRYIFGAKDDQFVRAWWDGRREVVMSPPGTWRGLQGSSGPPIPIELNAVEFSIREC